MSGTPNVHIPGTKSGFSGLSVSYEKDTNLQDIYVPPIPMDYLSTTPGKNQSDGLRIPNIVHFCWYTESPLMFRFIDYLGFMSAYKMLRPDKVHFHFNQEPLGPYWPKLQGLPRVIFNKTSWPSMMLGEKVKVGGYYTAGSNLCRAKQILNHGGIYMDTDVLVIRPMDEIRKYPCVMGLESEGRVCGGIIICEKQATFMKLWANSYLDDYRNWEWGYNSGKKPIQIWRRFPETVHIENNTINRPNWHDEEIGKIWGGDTWEWKTNFMVHTWYNRGIKHYRTYANQSNFTLNGVEDLKGMKDCTFKTIAQYILAA